MKTTYLRTWALATLMLTPLALAAGCGHEVSSKETDKENWTGGRTHEETKVYQNADGSIDTTHEKKTTDP